MSFISKPIYVTLNGNTFEVSMDCEEEFLLFINELTNMTLIKPSWSIKEGEGVTEPAKVSFSNCPPKS
jgi:hypothetical protein